MMTITMVAAGGGYGAAMLVVPSPPKGCPYLALYMQPGRVYMSCLALQVVASWASLGRQVGLPICLQLSGIGYGNGGVPGGCTHVRRSWTQRSLFLVVMPP